MTLNPVIALSLNVTLTAGKIYNVSISNFISSSANVGELIGGASNGVTLMGDFISNTTQECIHAYTNTTNQTITACTLKASTGARAINLSGN